MSLDEINDFGKFKKFIKQFILEDEKLFRLIYFPYSTPLDSDKYPYPDDPYEIFDNKVDKDTNHGVVIFRPKYDIVLNEEMPLVLVYMESAPLGNSKEYRQVFITFKIICKGTNVQELKDGENRINTIAKLINDNFDTAEVNGLGQVRATNFSEAPINEENSYKILPFVGFSFANDFLSNKNIQKRLSRNW